jgi:hypothetical protein
MEAVDKFSTIYKYRCDLNLHQSYLQSFDCCTVQLPLLYPLRYNYCYLKRDFTLNALHVNVVKFEDRRDFQKKTQKNKIGYIRLSSGNIVMPSFK